MVIPVYKVEQYIRQCLDSIILPADQMALLEVIVVNDGSPDHSSEIAQEYAERYSDTIRVINKENGGHGSAWNMGVSMATGKYLRFLDSDDWLVNLSLFLAQLSSIEADVVFTHLNKYDENRQTATLHRSFNVYFGRNYAAEDFSVYDTGNVFTFFNFHRATYRTSMLQAEQPLFCEKCFYDDIILYVAPMVLADSLYFLDMVLYNYRINRAGQTINKKVEKLHSYDYIPVSRQLIAFAKNHIAKTKNQEIHKERIIWEYMIAHSQLLASYPLKDFKKTMRAWFPIMAELPIIYNSRFAYMYNNTPAFLSRYIVKHYYGLARVSGFLYKVLLSYTKIQHAFRRFLRLSNH